MAYFFYALAGIPAFIFVAGCSVLVGGKVKECYEGGDDNTMPSYNQDQGAFVQMNPTVRAQASMAYPVVQQQPQPQQRTSTTNIHLGPGLAVAEVVVHQPSKISIRTQPNFT
jgi:hypothetical protein